ncbi:MAG: hypothetical protein AVDCRST_MAG93-901 [uncultured Chloroflexia bacterium]|uniref:ISKra4 family transposase n=1 Tax=uncultured Chloroflexia bacterium TaxID=1672391 RepID=A0A6J4HRM4_9CHLR|nr:MAG: hypothetical protein AVDCRST_MAG93-901 [uncultured Chloroflexia bacterium]
MPAGHVFVLPCLNNLPFPAPRRPGLLPQTLTRPSVRPAILPSRSVAHTPAPSKPTAATPSPWTVVMEFVRSARAGFFPLDEELALLPGSLTPRLQEGLVRLSTWIPSFAKAAAELAWFTGGLVTRDTARRITEAAGSAAVTVQATEVERLYQEYPPSPAAPERLVFHVDGAMVPLVKGEWAEVRTLAVGEVAPPVERDGKVEITTERLSYFSRLMDSASFSHQVWGELHRRGLEEAQRVGVVVDGAEWCQTLIDLHAPHAVRILDFAHAAEYVCAMGQTAGADGPLLTSATTSRLLHALKHEGPEAVLPTLHELVVAQPEQEELAKQYADLEKRMEQVQYPAFQAAGWPIGSGSVESANKLVVEDRLKGSGMHWARENVNPLLALRNAVCNDRWSEVWGQIEEEQRRQAGVRRQRRRVQRTAVAPATAMELMLTVAKPQPPVLVSEPSPQEVEKVGATAHHPKANHPWKRAWSVRRQREVVQTA